MSNQLGEPDKFELSSVVTKNSRMGITSNRRLLVIKGAKLYYYSNIPKFFDGNIKALEVAHQLPKCSIDIVNILNINQFDLNSPFFSIEFITKHMMEKEDIRNSAMNNEYNFTPHDSHDQVTWQFTCDNQFIKKRWVSALKSLKEYYKEEAIKIHKFMQNIDNPNSPPEDFKSSSYSSRSSIKMPVPWRDSNFSRKSYNVEFKEGSPKESSMKVEDYNRTEDALRVDNLVSLKKGKSDSRNEKQDTQFEMIIHEAPHSTSSPLPKEKLALSQKPGAFKQEKVTLKKEEKAAFPKEEKVVSVSRIEDAFKTLIGPKNTLQKPERPGKMIRKPSTSGPLPVPLPIEEVSEDLSVRQTPGKEHSGGGMSYSDSDSHLQRQMSLQRVLLQMKQQQQLQQIQHQKEMHHQKQQLQEQLQEQQQRQQKLFQQQQKRQRQQEKTAAVSVGMKKKMQVVQSYSIEVASVGMSLSMTEERNSFNNSKSFLQEGDTCHRDTDLTHREVDSTPKILVELEPCPSAEEIVTCSQPEPKFIQLGHQRQEERQEEEENEDEEDEEDEEESEDCEDQLNYRFQWLWGQSCKSSLSFDKRTSVQKQLLSEMLTFRERAIESIASWLESKVNGEKRYPILEESPRGLTLQVGNILLKIANVSTQRMVINGATKIFYNEDSLKNIKREFKIQQNLFKVISRQLKTQPTLRLRAPLSVYIEYKGVCCLATRRHQSETELASLDDELWQDEVSFLEGEGYKAEWFQFKQIGGFLQLGFRSKIKHLSNDEEGLKEYLKKVVLLGRQQKNHNLVFNAPINKSFLEIATNENASTSIQSLERYVKGLKLTKNLQGSCPKEEIIAALNYCIFCKQLRKVYRSAQGEISETHFFNLVFKQDPGLLELLQQSDCALPEVVNGQLFSFIEQYFGVTLELDEAVRQVSSAAKKDMFVSSIVRPVIRQYSLAGFELVQSYSKLTDYLQKRHSLAKAALAKKKQVFSLSENMSQGQSLELLHDEASYLYFQSDFTGCIKKCKEYEAVCLPRSPSLFPLYLLMLKAYSQYSEPDFTQTFKKVTQLIELSYGRQNSCLIELNSLAAFYYQKLVGAPSAESTGALQELSMRLMKQAQLYCLHCFGSQSQQYLDILLDSSRLYTRLNSSVADSYLQETKQLCQSQPCLYTPVNLIAILSYQTERNIKRGLYPQAQASLTNALSLISNKIPHQSKMHLYKLQHELGISTDNYELCEQSIEQLWQSDPFEKLEALELAYKLALKEMEVSEAELNLEEAEGGEWRERGLIELEQEKQHYSGLVDMLASTLENNNPRYISIAYLLTHQGS